MQLHKKIYGWYQSKSGLWYHKKASGGFTAYVISGCDECGDLFFDRKYKVKNKKGGRGKHYCSRSCSSTATVREQDVSHLRKYTFKKGQKPHNFKGRKRHAGGYVEITGDGKVQLEHRYIIEQFLGRKLKRSEVIHHVNGDRTDNRLENLRFMSQSEHVKLHWQEGAFANREEVKKQRIIQEYLDEKKVR